MLQVLPFNLAKLLPPQGYEFHGIIRRASTFKMKRMNHLCQNLHIRRARRCFHYGNPNHSVNWVYLFNQLKPDEIYHFGASTDIRASFDIPEFTTNILVTGTIRILEAIRETGVQTRFYQGAIQRQVRQCGRNPATGNHAVSSAEPVWCGQGVRLLGYCELPGKRQSLACNGIYGIAPKALLNPMPEMPTGIWTERGFSVAGQSLRPREKFNPHPPHVILAS